jgi:EmrB/QacA subfamily drug resistance transporter
LSSNTRQPFSPYAILALISFSVFLGALDLTVVSTILRQVIFDLEIPFPSGLNEAAWIVTGYLLAYTLTMPVMGRLSDLYSRRRVFLICLGLFVCGSIVVGIANTLMLIIAGRVLQALGAGALVPVSMAVVGDVFPVERRAVALGIIGAVDTAGWVVGPLYGALMVTQFQWRWVFFINIPLGVAAAACAFFALRDWDRAIASARMDYAGAVLLSVALASLSLALTGTSSASESSFATASAQTGGGLSPHAPILAVVFVVAAIAFWLRERRAPSPLIDLGMFRSATFSAACVVNLLVGGALIAAVVDVPLFVNTVMLIARGFTPAQADLQSGAILAILTTSMVVAAFVGGWLTERLGYRRPTLLGLVVAIVGFALLSRWGPALDNVTQARDLIVCGIGLGLVISPIATAVINTTAEQHRGTASAIVLILRLIGMTIVLSALTTWGVHRFEELSRALPLSATTAEFVARISAQVMGEIFALAAVVCAIALLPALFMRQPTTPLTRAVRSWW